MNNNFVELTNEQLLNIDGGRNYLKIAGGALIVAGTIATAPASLTIDTGICVAAGIIGGVQTIINGI